MSKRHSATKRNRRNKSGKRKDSTRSTMLALRSLEETARATKQAEPKAKAPTTV